MAWTDGTDLAVGELVTADIWNDYLGAAGSLMVVKDHIHDGTTGGGGAIPQLASQDHPTTTGPVEVDFSGGATAVVGPTTGNIAIDLVPPAESGWCALKIVYGGAHTPTFNDPIHWQGGELPSWTSENGKHDIVGLYWDSVSAEWSGNASLAHAVPA
jgi:hypothetical protein